MNNINFFFIILSTVLSLIFLYKIKFFANYFQLIDSVKKNKIHLVDTPKFGFFLSVIILINILFFFYFFLLPIKAFF